MIKIQIFKKLVNPLKIVINNETRGSGGNINIICNEYYIQLLLAVILKYDDQSNLATILIDKVLRRL